MKKITLSHGSGGTESSRLINTLFLPLFKNRFLEELGDSAIIKVKRRDIAFTIDSFVVSPLIFPGGDIGRLSVCGTVNDLAVSGARPKHIACAMIVEEGFDYGLLEKVSVSIRNTAKEAGCNVVTGDFKVVEKGSADGIFIITCGIGVIDRGFRLSPHRIRPGDRIIINGPIGDHGAAILLAREELRFSARLRSDCAPLAGLISLISGDGVKFMRDPTRGGVATTLNEIARQSGYDMCIYEGAVPVSRATKGLSEALGMDPLYMANEGKVLIIASPRSVPGVLKRLRSHRYGKRACVIGEVKKERNKRVYLETRIGGTRIIDMLTGELLPRIC